MFLDFLLRSGQCCSCHIMPTFATILLPFGVVTDEDFIQFVLSILGTRDALQVLSMLSLRMFWTLFRLFFSGSRIPIFNHILCSWTDISLTMHPQR